MADENEDNGTTRIEGRQLTAFIERRERLAMSLSRKKSSTARSRMRATI
jgi:hypothetical protein